MTRHEDEQDQVESVFRVVAVTGDPARDHAVPRAAKELLTEKIEFFRRRDGVE